MWAEVVESNETTLPTVSADVMAQEESSSSESEVWAEAVESNESTLTHCFYWCDGKGRK